jgi:transcriptional regulator with XRE-family HTH domain
LEEIGIKIRRTREEHGLTLSEVAQMTGLSVGFLSQVERNIADASVSSLKKIATAFNVKLKDFFENTERHTNLVRKNERSKIFIGHSKAVYELLAPNVVNRSMEPIYKTLKPGISSGLVDGHVGEEFLLVLQGRLQVQVGSEFNVVEEGDSLYFNASQAHCYKNIGDEDVVCIWIVTPPTFT